MKQINEDILIAEKYTLIKEAAKKTAHTPAIIIKLLRVDCCRGELEPNEGETDSQEIYDDIYNNEDMLDYHTEFTGGGLPSYEEFIRLIQKGIVVPIGAEEGTTYYGLDMDKIKAWAAVDDYCGYGEFYEEEVLLKKQKEVKDAISKNDQSGWDL